MRNMIDNATKNKLNKMLAGDEVLVLNFFCMNHNDEGYILMGGNF